MEDWKKNTIQSCPTFVRQITWGEQNHALRVGRILWTVYASLCPSPCFMSAFLAPPTMSPRFPPLSNNSPFCSPLMATLFTSSDCPHPSFLEQEEHNGAILTSNRNELIILLRSTPPGPSFYMEPMASDREWSSSSQEKMLLEDEATYLHPTSLGCLLTCHTHKTWDGKVLKSKCLISLTSNLLLLTKHLDLFGRRCGICWHNITIWSIVNPHLIKNISKFVIRIHEEF